MDLYEVWNGRGPAFCRDRLFKYEGRGSSPLPHFKYQFEQNIIQRIFGLGTIHIDSTDLDLKCLRITNIKDSDHVKEMLSKKVEEERLRNRVSAREFMNHGEDGDDTEADLDSFEGHEH